MAVSTFNFVTEPGILDISVQQTHTHTHTDTRTDYHNPRHVLRTRRGLIIVLCDLTHVLEDFCKDGREAIGSKGDVQCSCVVGSSLSISQDRPSDYIGYPLMNYS